MGNSRLWIYDMSELIFRNMAANNLDSNTEMIGVQSVSIRYQTLASISLRDRMVSLLSQGKRFNSIVFTTHGAPGLIKLDDDIVDARTIQNVFANHGLERLLLPGSRVYFAGCNVADKEAGWNFLETAARVFFKGSGGTAFGWTSYGFSAERTLGLIKNIVHVWGRTRFVMMSPDGVTLTRKDSVDIEHDLGTEMRKMELEREND